MCKVLEEFSDKSTSSVGHTKLKSAKNMEKQDHLPMQ